MRSTAQPGEILTGGYAVFGTGQGFAGNYVMFPRQLPAPVLDSNWRFVPAVDEGEPAPCAPIAGVCADECPGPGQAAAGLLCVYESNRVPYDACCPVYLGVDATDNAGWAASRDGFAISLQAGTVPIGNPVSSLGSWTYHMPG